MHRHSEPGDVLKDGQELWGVEQPVRDIRKDLKSTESQLSILPNSIVNPGQACVGEIKLAFWKTFIANVMPTYLQVGKNQGLKELRGNVCGQHMPGVTHPAAQPCSD